MFAVNGELKRWILGEKNIQAIRFPLMKQEEFAAVVLDTKILTPDEVMTFFKLFSSTLTSPVGFPETKRSGFMPGGGGVLGSIFAGYVPLASPKPYSIIVYSGANFKPHVSHFWANIPQILSCRNLLTPETPQMCDPILVTLLAPIENATPL